MQDYESNILSHLNPIPQQRESLNHESMGKETNSRNLEKDVEIMVINTMKDFGIDIEEEDDDKDDDETVDYKIIPDLRTLEWDDSSDSDIEHTIYPNISNSIVGEIGNQYNIDLSDIDFSSLGVDDIDNIIINATQMNAKDMEKLYPGSTNESLTKEVNAILERGTFEGVQKNMIPKCTQIHYTMGKHTVKYKDGEFDRVKSRTLFGGDRLKGIYKDRAEEISSRTISLPALYAIAAIIAHLELESGRL